MCVQECISKMSHQVQHILFCSSHKGLEGRKGADEFKFLILVFGPGGEKKITKLHSQYGV